MSLQQMKHPIRGVAAQGRDGTGSGFLTRDPTRPDAVAERCKTNSRQRLDSSIS